MFKMIIFFDPNNITLKDSTENEINIKPSSGNFTVFRWAKVTTITIRI